MTFLSWRSIVLSRFSDCERPLLFAPTLYQKQKPPRPGWLLLLSEPSQKDGKTAFQTKKQLSVSDSSVFLSYSIIFVFFKVCSFRRHMQRFQKTILIICSAGRRLPEANRSPFPRPAALPDRGGSSRPVLRRERQPRRRASRRPLHSRSTGRRRPGSG